MKLKDIKENEFQKCVNFWLRNNGYSFTRGNQGFKSYWVADSRGMPDLIIATSRGFKGIELKREIGKASDEQIEIKNLVDIYFGMPGLDKIQDINYLFIKPSLFFCENSEHDHLQKKNSCWDNKGVLKEYLGKI